MQVHKFGGSSVADATRICAMMDIVHRTLVKEPVILVCSAISGCTDELIRGGDFSGLKERHKQIAVRLFTGNEREGALNELDELFEQLEKARPEDRQTFGELFSTKIIAQRFAQENINTLWIDSRELIITGPDGKVLEDRTYDNIRRLVAQNPQVRLFVAPGFIASDTEGGVTNLGRGGSDYSAALYAAAVRASSLKIWTDVPGIMTANPKDVKSAASIPDISYEAALTLAENGAKVLYAPTVKPAMDSGIAIKIRNSFDPRHRGTTISSSRPIAEGGQWFGVTSMDFPQEDISRICLVGEGISAGAAVGERIVRALADVGIAPVGGVDIKGSVMYLSVRRAIVKESVAAIHREFFETRLPQSIGVYIAGYGAVGQALVSLIARSSARIIRRKGKSIKIAGIANSRKYVIEPEGIDPQEAASLLENGREVEGTVYVDKVCRFAPRKSVFVDCSDDEQLYLQYEKLFSHGINVVTSNRRSLSIPYAKYAALKAAARENGCWFRYDTTVGTALPILESVSCSANCSDEIKSVEAVLSCSLNNIITSYKGAEGESFAGLLKKAWERGLTEKDPRFDLGGKDVLRKLLIIAREAGVPLEAEDVRIEPFVGQELFDCPLEEFYRLLQEKEEEFVARENELFAKGLRQRFVALLRKDSSARLGYVAEIKLITVGPESPFYWINGTENVTVISSEHSAPLIIKGAGEGEKAAATGIIKDILM